ncbi:MAG TPA: hypothetical protein VFU37_17105 [Pyrinomonadaceae bacterium]|nr:hypothetical protein [Pyrinomonadaceae bacterium]
MKYRLFPVLFCLLGFSPFLTAQTNEKSKTNPAKNVAANNKTEKDPEAERILRERRANAQSMLLSLAADAGRYTDQTLRARTQARIADVLWSADPERARALFRKAWESAEIVDQEGQRKLQEEIKQQQAKGGSVAVTGPPNIRGEVLRLAARRDRALGEELLAKLKIEKEREATEIADKSRSNTFDSPEAMSQRLALARQLLNSDDVERALQFAAPALSNITRDGLDFLSYLREKDAAAADKVYASLLARAAGDLSSDANTVSLLSSYLFTPHTFVTFQGGGANTQSSRGPTPPPQDVSPGLRSAFFRTAADILMRPLAPPGQDQTTAGPVGKYLMLKRLMPLFEQYAAKELIEPLRGQMDALAQAVPEEARQRDDDTLREGIRPPQSSDDREKALRDRIDRAKTSDERDNLYIQLARLYVENGDLRAREFIDKVEDTDLRKQARAYIDATLVNRAVDKKEIENILELVRTGELTHLQKSWALQQAAKLLAKSDREKSLTTIDEATLEARRIETSDADRPRALMGVSNALLLVERPRAWDSVYEAIKAANSAEGFTGEDGVIRTALRTKNMSSIRSSTAADFNVAGIFTELAKEDYERTVELVRGFEREAPRASATIAVARSVLEEKKN